MNRKLQRKAKYLLSTTYYRSKEEITKLKQEAIDAGYYKELTWLRPYELIHEWFDFLGYFESVRKEYWEKRIKQYRQINKDYSLKPVKERKDNKDVLNSSGGGSNRNTIRYPRKVRSAACWRRFYKLFPHLKK